MGDTVGDSVLRNRVGVSVWGAKDAAGAVVSRITGDTVGPNNTVDGDKVGTTTGAMEGCFTTIFEDLLLDFLLPLLDFDDLFFCSFDESLDAFVDWNLPYFSPFPFPFPVDDDDLLLLSLPFFPLPGRRQLFFLNFSFEERVLSPCLSRARTA